MENLPEVIAILLGFNVYIIIGIVINNTDPWDESGYKWIFLPCIYSSAGLLAALLLSLYDNNDFAAMLALISVGITLICVERTAFCAYRNRDDHRAEVERNERWKRELVEAVRDLNRD